MTRLMKSSSLGGATPTVRPSHSRAPLNQFDGSWTSISGDQVSGPLKTTMSPGSGSPNQYGTLLTSTRSPVHPGQPCRVCSIDPEGMKNACTRKVLTTSASRKAITSRTGNSLSSEPFLACSLRRSRREKRLAGTAPPERPSGSPGSPASPGTTSAGPPGRSLLIRSGVRRESPAGPQPGHPAVVSARDGVALLLDLGGLAAQLAQVVQLRAADV